jgi:acetylornithine deacetylase/succinyl-diaminopimelate desuccinylase-like protein
MQSLTNYHDANQKRYLVELIELLKIPSVSADKAYKKDVLAAASWLEEKLKEAGMDAVESIKTPGYPVVYGEKMVDPSKPTVLVYGHYDVQPPDPLDLWDSPPFEPVIKDEKIYARGASDDKGQVYMHVKAIEAMIANDKLPCNVKIIIEGEEEVGSSHLAGFLQKHADKLACDMVMVSDTAMISNTTPSITSGLRGLSYVEVEVTGPNRDLHSGTYGGAVGNPINILCKMIASLHDENRHITIPGFYDDVETVSDEERELMAKAPFNKSDFKDHLKIEAVYGEKGYSTLERVTIRPTLDVNGIWGGYIGEGAKTVLPSKAYAKISMRLVPNQQSDKITKLFKKHFNSIAPDCVKVKVTPHHGGEPVVTPIDSIEYEAASLALKDTFGKMPLPQRTGGSIPIVPLFRDILGANTVLMGFGLDSDSIHSPNEHFGLFNYYRGIETIPYFYKHYTKLKST